MAKGKRGQMSIIGMVMVFASLICFVALYPAMDEVITDFVANSTDTVLNVVVQLIPLFIALGIIITLFMYVSPHRPD